MDQGDSAAERGMGVHAVPEKQIKDRKSGHGGDHYANHRRMLERAELKILCNNRSICGTFPDAQAAERTQGNCARWMMR
jgi:hypothetical protein